jgi:formylglycine-generating enzyme required for sulfatase activity
MAVERKNLAQCPRCDRALDASALRCGNCDFAEIENFDLLDVAEQREYKTQLQSQRAAWLEFDKTLRRTLQEVGEGWSKLEKWKRLWAEIESLARSVGFNERGTNERAERISKEVEPRGEDGKNEVQPEVTPIVSPPLEAVRVWVSELSDGEVDSITWRQFLQALDATEHDSFLEDFRDAEITRQFAQFETARVDAQGRLQPRGRKRVKRFVEKLGEGSELVMLLIPEGEFQMGSERYRWERPVHAVKVKSFCLGQSPVSQAQWRAVSRLPKVTIELDEHCSAFKGDNLPVDSVSWPEAAEFCARLEKQTGKPYRLPSEAEWEFACRSGSREEFSFGPNVTAVIVNYDGTHPFGNAAAGIFRQGTVPIGSLGAANDFGLYDMHGNVCEWCADEWHQSYEGAPLNGSAWSSGNNAAARVVRGGSWTHNAEICRSSERSRESADLHTKLHYLGFRVAMSF